VVAQRRAGIGRAQIGGISRRGQDEWGTYG
jgi:hypothetical protein